jgi:putative transposase
MKIFKAYKAELDPNNKQRTALLRHAGVAWFAWNWGLARRKSEYELTGKSSSYAEQNRQLNALKKTDFPWLYEVSKCVAERSLEDLDKAYKNFFRRLKAGVKPGFPKFKSKKNGIGSFCLKGHIHVFAGEIQLPRLGVIRLKENGYIPTDGMKILSATCSERAGRWFVSVCCEIEILDPIAPTGEPIGVDLGIKELAVCSNGMRFENPKALGKAQKKLRRLQRELSRRKKGSKNREKSKRKITTLHYRISNIRRDALHKATTAIVMAKPKPSIIVLEDLSVSNMMKNHHLARAISDVGLYEFRRQTEYKTLWCGEKLQIADRFFPSSKTCHVCGAINENLKLSDRTWTCVCGAVHDRDENASINLKNLVTASSAGIYACGQSVSPEKSGNSGRSMNQTLSLSQIGSGERKYRFESGRFQSGAVV